MAVSIVHTTCASVIQTRTSSFILVSVDWNASLSTVLTNAMQLIRFVTARLLPNVVHYKSCRYECEIEFNERVEKCPCMVGCPNGCPCPDYQCSSEFDSVLVIYGGASLKAVVADVNGAEVRLDLTVEGDVYTNSFCSLMFEDNFYIFG